MTCATERLNIVPNKVLSANLPSLSLSSQFNMFCSRLLFGISWETPEFQVVSAMPGSWQDCQLQTQSQSKDTAASVAYCDYFARYREWNMGLVDFYLWEEKINIFSAGDKNKILSLKLDLSVISAAEIWLKQCGWTTTKDKKKKGFWAGLKKEILTLETSRLKNISLPCLEKAFLSNMPMLQRLVVQKYLFCPHETQFNHKSVHRI